MKQFSSKVHGFFNLILPTLMMLIISISFVGAKSLHGKEMAGLQQQHFPSSSLSSSSADDSKENLKMSKSDEDDSTEDKKLDSGDSTESEEGPPPSSADEESDEHNKVKPVEITFDCYPQAESDVIRQIPQQKNRTVRQSAHIKLYIHCEQPKVTRLMSNFLMECVGGGKQYGHFIDYMNNQGRSHATQGFHIWSTSYTVGADCIGNDGEMHISNTCDNHTNVCYSFLKEQKDGRFSGGDTAVEESEETEILGKEEDSSVTSSTSKEMPSGHKHCHDHDHEAELY